MSDNPYQSPETMSGSREDVRSVALYQKGVVVCILVYLLGAVAQVVLALLGVLTQPLQLLIGIVILGVILAGAVFVFLLAMKVYGVALGILLGVLALVPLLGLLILLMVNGKATRVLRHNGVRVGFLGADLESI